MWRRGDFSIFRKFMEGVLFLVFFKEFSKRFWGLVFWRAKVRRKKEKEVFVVFLGSVLVSKKIFIFFIIFFSFTLFVVKIV